MADPTSKLPPPYVGPPRQTRASLASESSDGPPAPEVAIEKVAAKAWKTSSPTTAPGASGWVKATVVSGNAELNRDDGWKKPRYIEPPKYQREQLAPIHLPSVIFMGRPSLDGRYFALNAQEGGVQVIDLKQRRHIFITGTIDSAFNWESLVTQGAAISLKTLDSLEEGVYDVRDLSSTDLGYGGYTDPNSQFFVLGSLSMDMGPQAGNPPALIDSSNAVRIGRPAERPRVTGRVKRMEGEVQIARPYEWDFTVAPDDSVLVARAATRGSSGQRGYSFYRVNTKNEYSLTPLAKVEGLRGGKAKFMDHLLTFARQAEEGDHELFGFESSSDPEFRKLVASRSADVFVYDLKTNEVHRATQMGPGKQAWYPSFYRGESGEPVLVYVTFVNAKPLAVEQAIPVNGPVEQDRVLPKEVNIRDLSKDKQKRLAVGLISYIESQLELGSKHQSAHSGRSISSVDPELLLTHQALVEDAEAWLAANGYEDVLVSVDGKLRLPAWRPNQTIPEAFFDRRMTTRHPRVRTPTWLGSSNGPMVEPNFGYDELKQFKSPQELSQALTSGGQYGTGYHGAAHRQVGGIFASDDAWQTPLFFLLHRHQTNVLEAWFALDSERKQLQERA